MRNFFRRLTQRRRRTAITREGWYYIFVLGFVAGGALMREINLMLGLAAMMLGPLAFSWRAVTVMLRRLEVTRKAPRGVGAGELLAVELVATNRRRRIATWAVNIEDPIEPDPASQLQPKAVGAVLLPYVPAGQTRRVFYRGRIEVRGRYRLGPLKLTTRFPFGLMRGSVVIRQPAEIIVYPRLGRLGRGWSRLYKQTMLGDRRSQRRRGLTEDEFFGLRDWRAGDNRRWIHWRTSARQGRLMVRQFEQPRTHDLVLLVDLWRPPQPSPADLKRVELAASFAATVASELCHRGDSELLIGMAAREVSLVRRTTSMSVLPEFLELLATAVADPRDRLPELIQGSVDEIWLGARAILISTRPVDFSNGPWSELWADSRFRTVLAAISTIDVGSDTLAEYFQLETPRRPA